VKTALVPEWVVDQYSPIAIAVYAALDIHDGRASVVQLAEMLGVSTTTVTRGQRELRAGGACVRIANAKWDLRRDLSTVSTELSPADPQAETAAADTQRRFSTETTGPTAATKESKGQVKGGRSPVGSKGRVVSDTQGERPGVNISPTGRKRDVVFDALSDSCGCDPQLEGGRIAKAANELRRHSDYQNVKALVGRDDAEQLLAGEIHKRARRYRRVFPPEVASTPQALVRNWRRVVEMPERGFTPDEIASGEWRD